MKEEWREVKLYELQYEPRCSSCGRYGQKYWEHFFFTGMYCRSCIQDNLYGNVWSIEEVNDHNFFVWNFHAHENWRKER